MPDVCLTLCWENNYIEFHFQRKVASLIAQLIKNLPAMQETLVQFWGREDLLEKG